MNNCSPSTPVPVPVCRSEQFIGSSTLSYASSTLSINTALTISNGTLGLTIGTGSSTLTSADIGATSVLSVNSSIYSGGTVTAASDYRIKENLKLINLSEFNVDNLKPLYYYNKNSKYNDFGFIADEVQEIFPFLVRGEKDGKEFQSLNYNGFIALLTKEIQELKKKIQIIEEKISNI